MDAEYLVTYVYKGHKNSVVLAAPDGRVEVALRRRGIKGGIENICAPGDWHYDQETLCAVPNE